MRNIVDKKNIRKEVNNIAQMIIDGDDEMFERFTRMTKYVHKYSINNRVLILYQAPQSPMVASFSAYNDIAKEQGHDPVSHRGRKNYVVQRKGSSAVWILAIMFRKVEDKETGEEKEIPFFKSVPVWRSEDIVYLDNSEAFETPLMESKIEDKEDEEFLWNKLMDFAKSKNIEVVMRNMDVRTSGYSVGGKIVLREKGVSVLIHELAHEILHKGEERKSLSHQIIEGEAEATSAVVLRHFGHEASITAGYLRSHGIKPQDIIGSIERIVQASKEIIEYIEEGGE